MESDDTPWRVLTQYTCPICSEEYREAIEVEYLELVFNTPLGKAKAVLCPTCSRAYYNSADETRERVEDVAYKAICSFLGLGGNP